MKFSFSCRVVTCHSEETAMKQTDVSANRPWHPRRPKMLIRSVWSVRLTLQSSCLFFLFAGWKNWERPRNMRAPHRVPSRCNISIQTLLSVFTRDDFQKKQKVYTKWIKGNATVELCQRVGLLLLLHCVFLATGNSNQDYWGELNIIFMAFLHSS